MVGFISVGNSFRCVAYTTNALLTFYNTIPGRNNGIMTLQHGPAVTSATPDIMMSTEVKINLYIN